MVQLAGTSFLLAYAHLALILGRANGNAFGAREGVARAIPDAAEAIEGEREEEDRGFSGKRCTAHAGCPRSQFCSVLGLCGSRACCPWSGSIDGRCPSLFQPPSAPLREGRINAAFACGPPHPRAPLNLVYYRVPKCGSSTFGGILRRVAARHRLQFARKRFGDNETVGAAQEFAQEWRRSDNAQPGALWEPPVERYRPDMIEGPAGEGRDGLPRAFLHDALRVTMLREPLSRMLSEFYNFDISRFGVADTDENVLLHITDRRVPGAFDEAFGARHFHGVAHLTVREMFQQFSLVGVVELFDESVVLLYLALRGWGQQGQRPLVSLGDFLYIRAKTAGKAVGEFGEVMVKRRALRTYSRAVRSAAASWLAGPGLMDKVIHGAAVTLLRQRMRATGPTFNATLSLFRCMNAAAQTFCIDEDLFAASHLSQEAAFKCYWGDNGCRFPCLDTFWTLWGRRQTELCGGGAGAAADWGGSSSFNPAFRTQLASHGRRETEEAISETRGGEDADVKRAMGPNDSDGSLEGARTVCRGQLKELADTRASLIKAGFTTDAGVPEFAERLSQCQTVRKVSRKVYDGILSSAAQSSGMANA